ncbi:MAG: NUDIX hydrolase [Blastocatellia bacterium]|nr:NUDIX hydrolase [Blastocatellia bacterium]
MKGSPGQDPLPRIEQFSAGGVAVRIGEGGERKLAIILMLPHMRWQLPKGIIDPGETAEIAALREVSEEAGINCELVAPIDTINYWFTADRDGTQYQIHKFVSFFLMRYVGGDVEDHDNEVAEARWVSFDEALEMLVFETERSMVRRGREMADKLSI